MTIKAAVIDSREPAWVKGLKFGEAPTSVSALSAGDAWLATSDAMLVVERKTLSDLCASISDSRLITQVVAMVDVSPWCYVVVTDLPVVESGKLVIDRRVTGWRWPSVSGALLSVQELGAAVVWCDGYGQYKPTLERLAKRDRGSVKTRPPKREAIMETPPERALKALVDGLGDTRAEALLEHCGSLAWVLDFLTGNGGGKVPGVGKGTKAAARAVLGLDESMRLAVISAADGVTTITDLEGVNDGKEREQAEKEQSTQA